MEKCEDENYTRELFIASQEVDTVRDKDNVNEGICVTTYDE